MRDPMDRTLLYKKTCKPTYYVCNFAEYMIPNIIFRHFLSYQLAKLTDDERIIAEKRVDYYVKLSQGSRLESYVGTMVGNYKFPFKSEHRFSGYFFDLYRSIRYFPLHKRFNYIFGDVDYESLTPSFVKTRPITLGASNSVICKLDRLRHFLFVHDKMSFRNKKNQMVFRNVVKKQPHRTKLISMYWNHPLCDIGQVNDDGCERHPEYKKAFMSIGQMLKYKFVCSIEGHDVATNLKWIMSSNSVAVMPKPKIESWFMEGTLIGGYHYIEINDDYSNLEEKLLYYIAHPEEAETIIRHAHEYVNQFRNKKLEKVISIMVIKKYFERTGQV
jgi:hypothetical protein